MEERLSNVNSYDSGSTYHTGVFAITNTGDVAIRELKLQQTFYNGANKVIESNDLYWISSDDAPLLPGETRPHRRVSSVTPDYARYVLTVLEAE